MTWNKHYLKRGTAFERWLRFFNLLEPGHMVLSLSKLAFWLTAGVLVYCLIALPDQISAVLGSLAAFGTATSNYAYRRHKQYASGAQPYPKAVDTPSDAAQDEALNKL